MEKEKFKFEVGDIIEGKYSKSIFEVLEVDIVGNIRIKVIKPKRTTHVKGEILKKFQLRGLYILITRNQVKKEITYDIW